MKREERVSFATCAELLNQTSDLWKSSPSRNLSGFACAVYRKTSRSATVRIRPPGTRKTAKPTSTMWKDTDEKSEARFYRLSPHCRKFEDPLPRVRFFRSRVVLLPLSVFQPPGHVWPGQVYRIVRIAICRSSRRQNYRRHRSE